MGDRSRVQGYRNSGPSCESMSILSGLLKGTRTAEVSGQKLHAPMCANAPESMRYSTIDGKRALTPIYFSHRKGELEFQIDKRFNPENDDDNDTGSLTDGQNEEFSHDHDMTFEQIRVKRRERLLSVLTSKNTSCYNSYCCDETAVENIYDGVEVTGQ